MSKEELKEIVYPVVGACQEVHKEMGPFLNEYMYQDALAIELGLREMPYEKEFQLPADYKGYAITHKHFADFKVQSGAAEVIVDCKAVDRLADAHRQQLWNYMRLSKVHVGIVYNFGPVYAQCEKYYYDAELGRMVAF